MIMMNSRMRWAGHITCIGKMRIAGNMQGRSNLGNPSTDEQKIY
jgi:hypothetical protein